ncbi:DNA polymerase I, partial [Candidatus Kapabacteria bacterium]|nr:DNA polymerase I [Candidatus Kapabacteria bacterium]
MKQIYLIDAMSMVFRAFHAMYNSNLSAPDGTPTGAIFGFTNIITKLLEIEKPENIAVVFDTMAPTFRVDMYPEYKANRSDFPEELIPQVPKIKEILDLMGIPRVELDTYEADDIIGTLAKQASKEKIKSFCVTNDKDFMQLVDEYVKILRPVPKSDEMKLIDYDQVKEKFGVRPDQVIDVQALIGDSVDNVPGVKGIGEKTAGPMIDEYGSLENLYENIDKITKKAAKTKLENDKELAFLSKKLVTIKIDCPIDFTIDDTKLEKANFEKLDNLFEELGFNTLRRKWQERALESGAEIAFKEDVPELINIENSNANYELIDTQEKLDSLILTLNSAKILSFDLETDSLDVHNCEIVGIALSFKVREAFYIATYDDTKTAKSNETLFSEEIDKPINHSIPISEAISKIKPFLENKELPKCGQNSKFDVYILKRFGVNVTPISFDSMIASYCINPDSKHGMDALAENYLNYKTVSITSLIGEKKKDQKSMRDLLPSEISDYACEDADITLQLKEKLEKELDNEGMSKLAYEVEFPVVEVLTQMEYEGITIDKTALAELEKEIDEKVLILQKTIFEEAGTEFNIDSPKQLQHILFEKLQIPPTKKTKTGYSTDSQVLTELAKNYEIASMIEEYRILQKLNSTYVRSLPKLIQKRTGRLHTTYNQTVASTGRLSSVNPNLQNIPIKTDLGKRVRKAFIAKNEDYLLLSADYSQVELRIMAHICGDSHLIQSFKDGIDIHSATSAKIFNKDINEVSQDDRRIAKTVNFGIMYGLGAYGLAQRLDLKRAYAKEIIDNYFESYPGIKKYMDLTIEQTQENGFAETLCGRRRYFKNINSKNRMQKTADERAAI